jgi:hypothetical protein
MNSDPTETDKASPAATRHTRPPRPTKPTALHPGSDAKPDSKASPAALDEVFARLARNLDRLKRIDTRIRPSESHSVADEPAATTAGIGTIPIPVRSTEAALIDPASFRDLATEMDRQRDRLMQLLRDIEAGPAAD